MIFIICLYNVSVLPLEEGGLVPSNENNSTSFFLHVPRQELDFYRRMSCFILVFNYFEWRDSGSFC
jgi:hypothetical protein